MERPHREKECGAESGPELGRESSSSSGVSPVPSTDIHNIMPDGKGKIFIGSLSVLIE